MTRAAWLARRAHAWGCSELPALWLAADPELEAPAYLRQRIGKPRGHQRMRFVLEKAGIVEARSAGGAAARGTERERELLEQYTEQLRRGIVRGIDPESVRHADSMPSEWLPIIDRHQPRLACTPDAWGRDALGILHALELKCSVTERTELPWYWSLQVQGEMACMGADGGYVICGEHWAAHHGQDGPIRVWEVERDEKTIARARQLCADFWEAVEFVKTTSAEGE